ncbi:MAG: hypothetical protein AMJ79_06780 [Phycisphaerae bacterium SM23_30]|nr:MAG: hypothetical protein AMJ79_06780 [Phycisphaerae bacterium SM23_30]
MELWHIWVIAAIVLFILEIFTPAFVVACFGVGCLASGLAAYLEADIKWQVGIFSAATAVVLIVIRPLFLKYCYSKSSRIKTNVEALVGATGAVSERIDPQAETGRVKVGGDDWRAISAEGREIAAGAKVKVVKVEGAKVYVKRV